MTHSETACYDFGMSDSQPREVDSATPAVPQQPVAFPSPSQPGQCRDQNPASPRVSPPVAATPVLPGGPAGSRPTARAADRAPGRHLAAWPWLLLPTERERRRIDREVEACAAGRRAVHRA